MKPGDPTRDSVSQALIRARVHGRFLAVAELLVRAEPDLLVHVPFPTPNRRQIRSTNPLDRLNKRGTCIPWPRSGCPGMHLDVACRTRGTEAGRDCRVRR